MDEALKIESSKSPQASLDAYASADKICRFLVVALDDRAALLKQNLLNAQGHLTDQWENQWTARSTRYYSTVQAEYMRFIEAINRSEKPKLPPAVTMMVAVSFPPVPVVAPADKPASSNAPTQPYVSPLDRPAYDQHNTWSPWWGPHYYRR